MWTYETIADADPAARLNVLVRDGCTIEIVAVLPPGSPNPSGGVLIRFSTPDPPLPR